jgi:hypothetical protein
MIRTSCSSRIFFLFLLYSSNGKTLSKNYIRFFIFKNLSNLFIFTEPWRTRIDFFTDRTFSEPCFNGTPKKVSFGKKYSACRKYSSARFGTWKSSVREKVDARIIFRIAKICDQGFRLYVLLLSIYGFDFLRDPFYWSRLE